MQNLSKFKNVSRYGNTSRFQFTLRVFGEVFSATNYDTPEEAGFVCDLFKSILTHGFRLSLHGKTDFSLEPDVFRSRCQSVGLNPDLPISFCESPLLPESCRDFIRRYRSDWERNLALRTKHEPAKTDGDYARYSEDPTLRHWGMARDLIVSRLNQFKQAPRGWWGNLFLGLVGSVDNASRIIANQISPSFHHKLNPAAHPELFAKLHKAYEDLLQAETSARALVNAVDAEIKALESALVEHDKINPINQNVT